MIDVRNAKASIAYRFELLSDRAIQTPAPDLETGEWYSAQGRASGTVEDAVITHGAKANSKGFVKRIEEMICVDADHPSTISTLRRNGVLGIVMYYSAAGSLKWIPFKKGTATKADAQPIFENVATGKSYAYIDHEAQTVCIRKGTTFKLYKLVGDQAGEKIGATLTGVDQPGPGQGFFTMKDGDDYQLFALFGYGHSNQKQILDCRSFKSGKSLYVSDARVLPAIYTLQEPEGGFGLNGVPHIGMSSKATSGVKTPIAVRLTIPAPKPPEDVKVPPKPVEVVFPMDAFYAEMRELEGVTNWLYFDTVNLATTGIGNMIDTGTKLSAEGAGLNWRVGSKSGTSATPTQIAAEYKRLKALKITSQGGFAYEKHAKLFLSDASVKTLFVRKTKEFLATVKKYLPNFSFLHADAQLAIMSMAWNVGPNMFNPTSSGYWPNLTSALKSEDFWKAADNCEINGRPSVRNRRNRILFMQAARSKQFGYSRVVLRGYDVVLYASRVLADPSKYNGYAWWTQGMLRELGYYTATVDGEFGAISKAAFAEFVKTAKLTGGITQSNLAALSKKTLQLKVLA